VILEKLVSHIHGPQRPCQTQPRNGKNKHHQCDCFVHLVLSEVSRVYILSPKLKSFPCVVYLPLRQLDNQLIYSISYS
jgi:hypothetical protein